MITQVDHERLLKRPRELSIAITFGCARRLRAKRKVGSREGIEPSCRRPPALVAALLESAWVAAGPLEHRQARRTGTTTLSSVSHVGSCHDSSRAGTPPDRGAARSRCP
jgi:hypothetical protein